MWIFITHLWTLVAFTSLLFDSPLQIRGVQPGVRQGSEVWPGHARLQDREHSDVAPPHRQVTAECLRCCGSMKQPRSPGNQLLLSPSGGSTCTSLPKGPERPRCWRFYGTPRSGCDAFVYRFSRVDVDVTAMEAASSICLFAFLQFLVFFFISNLQCWKVCCTWTFKYRTLLSQISLNQSQIDLNFHFTVLMLCTICVLFHIWALRVVLHKPW